MAITGVPLILFLFAHMIGNLHIFLGPDALNGYAHFLQGLGPLLWIFRMILITLFVVHVFVSATLVVENQLARPKAYSKKATLIATLSSRTMIYTGTLIVACLVYHLLHFTVQSTDPIFQYLLDKEGRHDVYRMISLSFSYPTIAGAYMSAVILLGFHLNHSASSFFQSLGLNNHRFHKYIQLIGPVTCLILVVGFSAVPFSILMGWIR